MKLVFSLTCLAVLMLASCSPAQESAEEIPESERKEITSAVINRFNAMIKYSEAGELENVLKHFDPSGPGSYIERGSRYASLQDMIDNYRATWKVKSQDYGVPDTKVYVLSRNFALVTSSSTLTTTTRDGVAFLPRPWAISTLWTFKEGQWLIHSVHQFDGEMKAPEEEKEEED